MSKTVKIGWYCGYYVGPMKWQRYQDWVYEPDECGTEFETIESLEEWKCGDCVAACPHCGANLYQSEDKPWLVKEQQSENIN